MKIRYKKICGHRIPVTLINDSRKDDIVNGISVDYVIKGKVMSSKNNKTAKTQRGEPIRLLKSVPNKEFFSRSEVYDMINSVYSTVVSADEVEENKKEVIAQLKKCHQENIIAIREKNESVFFPLKKCAIRLIKFTPYKYKADIHNKYQTIADCLVKSGIIEDDNDFVISKHEMRTIRFDRLDYEYYLIRISFYDHENSI